MRIRAKLKPNTDLVMFNTNHRRVNNITAFARRAWKAMMLPGNPSLTDLRTAVATMVSDPASKAPPSVPPGMACDPASFLVPLQSRNTQCSDVRNQMSKVMCHDTRTADKFYALQLDVNQMAEMRRRFDQARETAPEPAFPPSQ